MPFQPLTLKKILKNEIAFAVVRNLSHFNNIAKIFPCSLIVEVVYLVLFIIETIEHNLFQNKLLRSSCKACWPMDMLNKLGRDNKYFWILGSTLTYRHSARQTLNVDSNTMYDKLLFYSTLLKTEARLEQDLHAVNRIIERRNNARKLYYRNRIALFKKLWRGRKINELI